MGCEGLRCHNAIINAPSTRLRARVMAERPILEAKSILLRALNMPEPPTQVPANHLCCVNLKGDEKSEIVESVLGLQPR